MPPLDGVTGAPILTPRADVPRAEDRLPVTVTIREDADVERWVTLVEALMAVRLKEST
jgi:hypothetical protein